MKLSVVLGCFFALAFDAHAFLLPTQLHRDHVSLKMGHGEENHAASRGPLFGVVTAATAAFLFSFHPLDAYATNSYPVAFESSSVQVADAIKLLDMSMPSYGDIKDSKASVENVKSLSVQGGQVGILGSQKKSGMPVSSVLPSMGKQSAKDKAAEKAAEPKIDSASMKYDF